MSTLYVTEFNAMGASAGGGNFPIAGAYQPPVTEQTVSIGGSSASSSPFNTNTHFVRLHSDSICSIEIGASPTATTSTARFAANQTEYFAVVPGHSVAVITNT